VTPIITPNITNATTNLAPVPPPKVVPTFTYWTLTANPLMNNTVSGMIQVGSSMNLTLGVDVDSPSFVVKTVINTSTSLGKGYAPTLPQALCNSIHSDLEEVLLNYLECISKTMCA